MNRDNALFLVIGALAGFISGYIMHEAMAARQPAPRRPIEPQAVAQQAAPSAAQQQPGAAPAMEQVQRLRARVEENPNDAEAVRLLANLNYDISNWGRAASLYAQYLELEPDNVDVMTDLGAVYRNLSRPEDALEQFREARRRVPEHWQALYNEILVLAFDLADLETARARMNELLEQQPENPNVQRLAAELERRRAGAE
ncbi:MAG: tetratricopeptide repeat protein [Acidobacteriota bacterium]